MSVQLWLTADIAHILSAVWCAMQAAERDPAELRGALQALGSVAVAFGISSREALPEPREARR